MKYSNVGKYSGTRNTTTLRDWDTKSSETDSKMATSLKTKVLSGEGRDKEWASHYYSSNKSLKTSWGRDRTCGVRKPTITEYTKKVIYDNGVRVYKNTSDTFAS